MKTFFKNLYLNNLFFYCIMAIIVSFVCAFFFPAWYNASWYLFYLLGLFTVIDAFLLFLHKNQIIGNRKTPEKFSNGDDNEVFLSIENGYGFTCSIKVIDEIPFQFQKRDFQINRKIKAGTTKQLKYFLRPTERGVYTFGALNIYASSPIGLVAKRYRFSVANSLPNYPSYLQLKKYELMAFSNNLVQYGMKKVRRIGQTMEFEQIKEYVQGDNIKNINWKATAKKNALMINQYQDEKSQNVYIIIDKGRVMQMPFNGLSLLDYSINSALALANIIIKKQDKAGLLTFAKRTENWVKADKRSGQMQLLLENLYQIKTNFIESDYSRLYADVKRNIKQRSLLLLFTNFETLDGLNRQLPYLKGLAKNHKIIVLFFKNTEVEDFKIKKAETVQEIYDKTIAEKLSFEKRLIVNELRKYGISTVLTKPENLTLESINKYIEIKAKGVL